MITKFKPVPGVCGIPLFFPTSRSLEGPTPIRERLRSIRPETGIVKSVLAAFVAVGWVSGCSVGGETRPIDFGELADVNRVLPAWIEVQEWPNLVNWVDL